MMLVMIMMLDALVHDGLEFEGQRRKTSAYDDNMNRLTVVNMQ